MGQLYAGLGRMDTSARLKTVPPFCVHPPDSQTGTLCRTIDPISRGPLDRERGTADTLYQIDPGELSTVNRRGG